MAKSIRSKIKRKFRAIKRAKLDAKKAAEKESAKAEAVFARMEGVEAGDGTELAGSEAELEQEEDVLANNSTLTKVCQYSFPTLPFPTSLFLFSFFCR